MQHVSEKVSIFLENQHPLVRSNLRMGLIILGVIVLLHVLVELGLRFLEHGLVFQLNRGLRLFNTLLLLLIIILLYNTLKVIFSFLAGKSVFTWQSVVLAGAGLMVVVGANFWLPNIFSRSIALAVERPYNSVYNEFAMRCDLWEPEYRDAVSLYELDLDEEDLGSLREEAEVFKISNTVFFNFAESGEQEFGFACALRDDAPAETGRARHYQYQQVEGIKYLFLSTER